jgi:hypothetical protein
MVLRSHPGLNFWRAWPPVWVVYKSKPTRRIIGEVGVFQGSLIHPQLPARLFLRMEYLGDRYTGCLALKDQSFCRQLHEILKGEVGRPISEIGSLDLSHLM